MSYLDDTLRQIKCEVRKIEDKLDHPDTGLVEIKREIRSIENKLGFQNIPAGILDDILCEIRRIEDKLDHPTTGLVEIKREIRSIENKLGIPVSELVRVRTSGPVQRRLDVNSVIVVALNNTDVSQSVTISVFGFEPQCPKINVPNSPFTVVIEPQCSHTEVFDVTVSNNFEVQIEAEVSQGIFVYAGGRNETAEEPVFPSTLVGANIVLNAAFTPQFVIDC